MGPKYEFTDETIYWNGHILHRIKRLSDSILGGWIESEDNLSQEGNCWVDGEAMVYDNAKVSGNAQVSDEAKVYGNATICQNAYIYDSAQVYGDAIVSDNIWIFDNAQVYGQAKISQYARVYGNAKVYDKAEVYDYARVCGQAEIYGDACITGGAIVYDNARVYDDAKIYGDAKVYGRARAYFCYICDNAQVYDKAEVYGHIYGNAQVYGNTQIYGHGSTEETQIYDNAKIYGNTQVYNKVKAHGDALVHDIKIFSGEYTSGEYFDKNYINEEPLANPITEVVQDFIYKVDDSNKLTTQTEYDSVDEFFNEPAKNDIKLDTLVICTIDTKEPLIKLQKVEADNRTEFKFIVDIINEDNDNFMFKSIIKSQEQLNQLIQKTIEALRLYPKFNKYANDLEEYL